MIEFIANAPTREPSESQQRHAAWLASLPAKVGPFHVDAANGLAIDSDGNQYPLDMFSGIPPSELEDALFAEIFEME